MRNGRNNLFVLLAAIAGIYSVALSARAQVTNSVTAPGFFYAFNGSGNNPTLTLYRGVTYVFALNALGHPFFIKTNFSAGTTDLYTSGVVNNGADTSPVIFTVPAAAPNQLFYNCSTHSILFGMHGTLNISNAPAPPSGQIVLISLSPTGVTMKSLGSASWTAVPEYNSNLTSTAWAAVPGYNNVFANGTNTTTFDRLDAICGPNVFLRIHSKFP